MNPCQMRHCQNSRITVFRSPRLLQVRAGLKAIYCSGWQVAGDANSAGDVYPDQSLYPVNSVPEVVRKINRVRPRQQLLISQSRHPAVMSLSRRPIPAAPRFAVEQLGILAIVGRLSRLSNHAPPDPRSDMVLSTALFDPTNVNYGPSPAMMQQRW